MDAYRSERQPTYPELPCVKLEDLTAQRRSRHRKMVLTLMLGLLVGLTGRLETWAAPMGLDFQAKEIGLADTRGELSKEKELSRKRETALTQEAERVRASAAARDAQWTQEKQQLEVKLV